MKHEIELLRERMAKNGIDGVIVPQADPHQSEYLSPHWQARRWLSGFTGSAGTLVVTQKSAKLWTDSRYFIQGAAQLEGTGIELMKDGLSDTPKISQSLISELPRDAKVGIDGMLFSIANAANLENELGEAGIELVKDFDPVEGIWEKRPEMPKAPVFVHDVKYAGQDAKEKISELLVKAEKAGAESVFLSALDEIAWTLNIRSTDVKHTPVATSFLYLSPIENVLFVDPDKITPEVKQYLQSQGISTLPYSDVTEFLSRLNKGIKVLMPTASTSATIAAILGDRKVEAVSPAALPKAIKNDTQIKGFKAAMVRDGVAMVKALMELEDLLAHDHHVTEISVSELLRKHRSQQDLYVDESFGTIAGYGPHGAIVHYEATPETDVKLHSNGLLLIDSGAQYLDGTTDITRTICLGKPTAQEKLDFTLVTKGHIALARAIFPKGTHGVQLDALARQFLWERGLSYMHGTGHGVGQFLCVHEGPQSIRMNYIPQTLEAGMITSNEPGLYREGVHGIRTENLLLTVPAFTTEFGEFLKFETITLFPYDVELFDTTIMTIEEIAWVNDYHSMVYSRLSEHLNAQEKEWLSNKTRPLVPASSIQY